MPPSELLARWREGLGPESAPAWDTETSGLYADDGARTSTVSVAFTDEREAWKDVPGVNWAIEEIAPGYEVPIVSLAWPFDQGVEGKEEDSGQGMLWAEADNLPVDEYVALNNWLEEVGRVHGLTAHNAKFDLEKMRVGCRRWPGVGVELVSYVQWDTQNVNAFLWPLEPTSLKPTCARLFGKEWADEGAKVKAYLSKAKLPAGRWDLMPWSVIGVYADTDARITKMLELRQMWEIAHGAAKWLQDDFAITSEESAEPLNDPTRRVYEKIERRLAQMKALYLMERRGLPYDEVMSREAGIECRARAKEVAKALPFAPPTDTEAKKFFFSDGVTSKGVECLDRVPYSLTDKGAPSLTAEVLGRMVNDRVPHAEKWAEYNKVTTAASMWYEGYADKMGTDGRLRTCFRQNGTRSSRISVERVNLQAIPQDYRLSDHSILDGIPTPREIIAAGVPNGWRIFELDLAQAELRVSAMFAKCTKMIEMIVNGDDLHDYTTKELFPDVPESDPLFKSKWRQVGKRGNFSLGFGSGGPTFQAMVSKETGIRLTDQEAVKIVRDWNGLFPEFGDAIQRHMRVVEKRQARFGYGWIDYINGERRWFQQYEEAHKAFNQRVQGNLGQFGIDWTLMNEAFLGGHRELEKRAAKDEIGEAGLVLTIHDSQVLLLPDDDFGKELAEQCAQFGRDLWKQMFPEIPGGVDYHEWMYTE